MTDFLPLWSRHKTGCVGIGNGYVRGIYKKINIWLKKMDGFDTVLRYGENTLKKRKQKVEVEWGKERRRGKPSERWKTREKECKWEGYKLVTVDFCGRANILFWSSQCSNCVMDFLFTVACVVSGCCYALVRSPACEKTLTLWFVSGGGRRSVSSDWGVGRWGQASLGTHQRHPAGRWRKDMFIQIGYQVFHSVLI